MTKEQEKETIKYLEFLKKEYLEDAKQRKENGEFTRYGTMEDIDKLRALYIGFALNMLKEKDEQIAKYEKIYKENDCYRWVKELEKKDKQIDLMVRAIDNYDSQLEINTFRDKEHVKQYFKEIAERKSENETK